MDINKYKKLKGEIDNRTFHDSFRPLNKTLKYLSVLGNFGSIFLASFFISELFKKSVPFIESNVTIWIITLLLLGSLELIKRFIFNEFSIGFVKVKNIFNKSVFPLAFFSLCIIGMSFYSSLNGAKEFSSKSDIIEEETNVKLKTLTDSIRSEYNPKIEELKEDIRFYKNSIREKDKEQVEVNKSLQDRGYLYRSEKQRNEQLSKEKEELEEKVSDYENRLELENEKLKEDINNLSSEYESKKEDEKDENKSNSIIFIFISTTIEFLILIGIYFNKYFNYRSYNDMRKKINQDPNYRTWSVYSDIINILFMSETDHNKGGIIRLPSSRELWNICRMQDLPIVRSDFDNSLRLFNSLGITETKGSSRFLIKNKEESETILKDYFKVK